MVNTMTKVTYISWSFYVKFITVAPLGQLYDITYCSLVFLMKYPACGAVPLFTILFLVVGINQVQDRCPRYLPPLLRTWAFLPAYLRHRPAPQFSVCRYKHPEPEFLNF